VGKPFLKFDTVAKGMCSSVRHLQVLCADWSSPPLQDYETSSYSSSRWARKVVSRSLLHVHVPSSVQHQTQRLRQSGALVPRAESIETKVVLKDQSDRKLFFFSPSSSHYTGFVLAAMLFFPSSCKQL
jgi:hypothetical protein